MLEPSQPNPAQPSTAQPDTLSRLPPGLVPALLTGLGMLAARAVGAWVLHDFPGSADEAVYHWQALAFASGHVVGEIPEPRDTFALFHLGDVEGVRFGRFPPGWPMLLALGVTLGLPGWINPLLGGLALAGMYLLARAHVGARNALLGTVLVGASPFFLVNAASFHSHVSSLFALTGLALCLERGLSQGPGGAPGLRVHDLSQPTPLADPVGQGLIFGMAGLFFGLAVTIRSYTALLLGLPLIATAVWRSMRSTPTRCLLLRSGSFVLGGLPFLAFLLYVNHCISGDPFRLPTTLVDGEEGIGLGIHGHTLVQGMQNTLVWSIEALAWTFFMSPLVLPLARRKAGTSEALWWMLLAAPILGYVFYWNPGGNRYGPRFWFEALLPFTLLAGVGLARALELRRQRWLLVTLGVVGVLVLVQQLKGVEKQSWHRAGAHRTVASAGLEHAIVLLLGSVGGMPVYDLTRNPPDFRSAPVLYGRARGNADLEVQRLWPDRSIYYYRWDESGGVLTPFDPLHLPTPDPIPGLADALEKG